MKKLFFAVFFIFLIIVVSSCSTTEQRVDRLYAKMEEIESLLADSALSSDEQNSLLSSLDKIKLEISDAITEFAVDISPDSIDLIAIPYNSSDLNKLGEWYYSNLVYPLYCYESDYAPLYVRDGENFTSQEKFNIISYHLYNTYSSLLDQKYSYLNLDADSADKISLSVFGEELDKTSISEYSEISNSYRIMPPLSENRLLTPIFDGIKIRDVTKTELTVHYAEQTNTRVIYSEIFVFEKTGDNLFYLYSRVRKNQSISLTDLSGSEVSQESIYIPEFVISLPDPDGYSDNITVSYFLLDYYCSAIDNYSGNIIAYKPLSVRSLLNMIILLQPQIDLLIANIADEYQYFGIPSEFFNEQVSQYFGNSFSLDESKDEFYDESLDLYLYQISEISKVQYTKQVLSLDILENGYVRMETALFAPNSYSELIAKEVVVFSDNKDGTYSVFSRHYNMHTASVINSVVADTVPLFPEIYPDTSVSDITKGVWLYKNYGSLLDFEFDSVSLISSELLADFAVERLFETQEFQMFADNSCIAFPKALVKEEVRLYFGNAVFIPEMVSYYDLSTEMFYVNVWTPDKNDTSGTVISAGGSSGSLFKVYIEKSSTHKNTVNEQYILTFNELSNGSFRFVSAVTTKQ
ncbi:MAG: hypothetical protein IJL30_04215 [Clostridia bacterium]|nr:hypothetical protein [Clostridia bacterium]